MCIATISGTLKYPAADANRKLNGHTSPLTSRPAASPSPVRARYASGLKIHEVMTAGVTATHSVSIST